MSVNTTVIEKRSNNTRAHRVTVGVPTFQRVELLKETLSSLLNQTTDEFKIIVGNNDSNAPLSSNSLGLCDDGRIEFVNHSKNLGQIENMRFLLSACETPWFTWLNDDDLMHPRCLEILLSAVHALENNIIAVFCNYASSATPRGFDPVENAGMTYLDTNQFILQYTAQQIPLIGCYGLLSTGALKALGPIKALGSSFGPYTDTLLPIRLAPRGRIAYTANKLLVLRTHPGSLSVRSKDFEAYTSAQEEFLQELRAISASSMSSKDAQLCVRNMLWWFARDSWHVLLRSSSGSRMRNTVFFLRQQISVNLPHVPGGFRFSFLAYLLHLVTKKYRGLYLQMLRRMRLSR